jgi:large subunit ribosomal protein L5
MTSYRERIVPALKDRLKKDNVHAVPKLAKVVVSMGVGTAIQDSKHLDEAVQHLGQLTGQKPQITRSRKSIAQFRLREGMQVGCRVTLRGRRMYEFVERLVNFALPRVRDFRGLNPNAFDGNGNYSLGLTEQLVFPEINADQVQHVQGMNITFVTTAKSDDEARELLRELGMPLRDK